MERWQRSKDPDTLDLRQKVGTGFLVAMRDEVAHKDKNPMQKKQQLLMPYGLACLWEGGKGWIRSLVWAAVRHLVWPAAAGTHPTGPGSPQSPAAASPE